jgi:hypothetical protein
MTVIDFPCDHSATPPVAVLRTRARKTEGYVFSDPSRSHRFVFVDQAAEDIDPANAWRVG